jgi:hypothetical protein
VESWKKRAEAERRRQAEFDRKAKVISEAADAWQTSNRIRDFAMALSKAGESQDCSRDHVRDICAPRNQCRCTLHHRVPDFMRSSEFWIARANQFSLELAAERRGIPRLES